MGDAVIEEQKADGDTPQANKDGDIPTKKNGDEKEPEADAVKEEEKADGDTPPANKDGDVPSKTNGDEKEPKADFGLLNVIKTDFERTLRTTEQAEAEAHAAI